VVSSYTPTITSLLRVQQAAKPLPRDIVSLALVAEKRAAQRNLELIPGVDKEIELVAAVANLSSVEVLHQCVGSTTIEDTSRVMEAASIVHLACHGIQDVGDATQSGFCLGDGRLTIAKLMELNLDNAFLAFLSACETAKGDKEQPDQVMHLAAAMLFSGFKSVIATMWYVDGSCCEQAGTDQRQGNIRCRGAQGGEVVLRGVAIQGVDRCRLGGVRSRLRCA
jgi:CHAT domain-containing protein